MLLDESTSALDLDNEAALYETLLGTSAALISVSHRPPLVRYHTQVLELKPEGAWELHSAEQFQFTEELAY